MEETKACNDVGKNHLMGGRGTSLKIVPDAIWRASIFLPHIRMEYRRHLSAYEWEIINKERGCNIKAIVWPIYNSSVNSKVSHFTFPVP